MPRRPAERVAIGSSNVRDATSPPTERRHFACIEGIRAIAASLVVVHHAASTVGRQRAGWLATPAAVMDGGVAIFFVLSGFLIYRPFARAHLGGTRPQRTGTFLWRRIVRIVPAYWCALTILWATGSFSLGTNWWRYYLFLQVYDAFTTLGGIVPAWSLNTEMTFYLMVPIWSVVVRRLLHRSRPARPLHEVAAVLALGATGYVSRAIFSASKRVWVDFPGHDPVTMREVSFSWLPNNIDLFAAGMLIAVLSTWADIDRGVHDRLDRVVRTAGWWWLGAAALFVWFAYRIGPPALSGGYKGLYWQQRQLILAALGVLLIAPAVFGAERTGAIRRLLASRPVVWVGMVSYGFYLWHLDLLGRIPAWVDRPATETPVIVMIAGGFALGLAAAALSWYLLERPLQRLARRPT